MFFLQEPSDEEIRQFLSAQEKLPFYRGEVGASREDATADLSPGYAMDRYHMKLGEGTEAYARRSRLCAGGGSSNSAGYDSSRQGCRARSAYRCASSPGIPVSGR